MNNASVIRINMLVAHTLCILALCIVCLLVHRQVFSHYFIFDDFYWINDVLSESSFIDSCRVFYTQTQNYYRPLPYVLMYGPVQLFQRSVAPYYAITVVQHTSIIVLFYSFVFLLFKDHGRSFLAALLAIFCTAYGEGAIWFSHTFDMRTGVIFGLLSLICFCRSVQDSRIVFVWYICSLVFYLAALFSYEISVVFSVLFVILSFLRLAESSRKSMSMRCVGGPFALLALAYLWLVFTYFSSPKISSGEWKFGFHIFDNIAHYIAFFFFPSIHFPITPSQMPLVLNEVWGISATRLVIYCSAIILTLVACWRSNISRFFVAWLYLSLIPVSFFVDHTGTRWTYLPWLGVCGIIATYFSFEMRKIRESMWYRISFTGKILLLSYIVTALFTASIDTIERYGRSGERATSKLLISTLGKENIPSEAILYFEGCLLNIPVAFKRELILSPYPQYYGRLRCIDRYDENQVIEDGYVFSPVPYDGRHIFPLSSRHVFVRDHIRQIDWEGLIKEFSASSVG